jgi:amidase
VLRLKAAGCIVHGKTNTPEFGTTPWTEPDAYPPARNPWDTDRTPGGSSGGAAAAVAAGLCPAAHGSDGGGSIRIPASVCGLYGIKPSRGRVSAAPGPQSLLSQSGPITRTVADAAALLDAMSGYASGDGWWTQQPERPFLDEVEREPGRLRIAWTCTTPNDTEVAPGNRSAAQDAARCLDELGHHVAEAAPPWPSDLTNDFMMLWCVSRAAVEPAPPIERFGRLNRALAEVGMQTNAADYARASGRIQAASRALVAFFDDVDVLLTPTVATPPPRIGEFRDDEQPMTEFFATGRFVPFTPPWNATGQPAVTVPWGADDLGLPVGIQLVGRPADEATLIRLSAQLEKARPWAHLRPPVV